MHVPLSEAYPTLTNFNAHGGAIDPATDDDATIMRETSSRTISNYDGERNLQPVKDLLELLSDLKLSDLRLTCLDTAEPEPAPI